MPKKFSVKKKVTKVRKKRHNDFFRYLRFYFLLVFVGLLTFSTATLLFKHHTMSSLGCANSKSCTSDLYLNIENNVQGIFQGKTVYPPIITLADKTSTSVLGVATASGEKHIYVDLSTQTLVAYQGKTQILKTLVSTGKWNRTPTGNFHIWEKLLATRMAGGEGADAYDLPNVPYVMYFYNDFGLHGAYWHDNFGHEMSHGCVNLRQVDAKKLYDWADGPSGNTLGTEVSICDQITKDNQCVQNNPVQ